jgi:hypothetical protein
MLYTSYCANAGQLHRSEFWGATSSMSLSKLCTLVLCFGLLFTIGASAQTRDPDSRDLHGISPSTHKYLFTVLGGAAARLRFGICSARREDATEAHVDGRRSGQHMVSALSSQRPWKFPRYGDDWRQHGAGLGNWLAWLQLPRWRLRRIAAWRRTDRRLGSTT